MPNQASKETHTFRVGRRQAVAAMAMALGGVVTKPNSAAAQSGDDVSHSAEAIHQEAVFNASRKRVYEVLTDTKQFDRLIEVGGSNNSTALGNEPTSIDPSVGGKFVLFGGHIFGRQVELVPNERIVQAWRVADWEPGIYSIARFELIEQGTGTKIAFDHTGFPKGLGAHLAFGWTSHYWEPMKKLLA